MSFLCKSLALFVLINVAVCCPPDFNPALVEVLATPACNVSSQDVTITYRTTPVDCGSTVPLHHMFRQPAVSYSQANPSQTYTLLMVTADTPESDLNDLRFYLNWAVTGITSQTYTLLMITADTPESDLNDLRFHLNWAVTGITGYDLHGGYIPPSNRVYLPPSPTQDLFRYKFILLEEGSTSPSVNVPRVAFNLGGFISNNNLCDSLVATYEVAVEP